MEDNKLTDEEKKIRSILKRITLDHYCSEILKLLWHSEGMRFNEIHRQLQNTGITLSKPSLSEHLKHLIKRKHITRRVIGVQNVVYCRVHRKINLNEKELAQQVNTKIQNSLLEGIMVHELTPESKSNKWLCEVLMRKLEEVTLRIEIEYDTQTRLDSDDLHVRFSEGRLLEECYKNDEFRVVTLEKTKDILKVLTEWRDTHKEKRERKFDLKSDFSSHRS